LREERNVQGKIHEILNRLERAARNIQDVTELFECVKRQARRKDNADQQEAMATLSQQSSRESAGLTSLGALLRAKLDNTEK
jgi:hypothetical protein